MCTFNLDYVTDNRMSQLRTMANNAKYVFYDCPSYVIYVKRPHKFLRTVQTLRENGS